MTSYQTSTQVQRTNVGIIVLQVLGVLFSNAALAIGGASIVEYIGSTSGRFGQMWLSEFIQQHLIWATVIYFCLSFVLMSLSFPFFYLHDKTKRDIFIVGPILLSSPLFVTFLVGFYRSILIVWNATGTYIIPVVSDYVAAYRLKAPLIILIVIAAVASSYAAYATRTFKRVAYGISELLFGLGSIMISVYTVVVGSFIDSSIAPKDIDIGQPIFGFLAGVYIIVRGLVNIEDGMKQGPLTPRLVYRIIVDLLRNIKVRIWFIITQSPRGGMSTGRKN